MACTETSTPLAYAWIPGEGLIAPEPETLKVNVQELEAGAGVGPDVDVAIGVGEGATVGFRVGLLVGVSVGVEDGIGEGLEVGVGVRFVGVGVGDAWVKMALTSRSRLIVMDTGLMFTCTVSSRSQWSNAQFALGMAWTGTSMPLVYVWVPGEGLVVPEPVTLKVNVQEFGVGVGVGLEVGMTVVVGAAVGVGVGVGPLVGVGVGVGDGLGEGLGVGSV